ncbi:MAG TPA: wax ester/triacylglycerol synthase family O-acyltransferase [Solirubrobacterales bacterium]|nr:wax ester/triacylglycerol synthase family O-acyltransferase [Solirubrobacterales bacterium]
MSEATERLSASDMSSLLAERGPIHVHVGATMIFEGKPPDFDDLLAHVEKRLSLVPRFRQRITPIRFNLDNPVWADDPRFDLRWHVRRAALPAPGGLAELRELVGRIMSEPLDFTRPLWQLYLVEGIDRKRFAVVPKTHHALVDGVAAVDVGTIVLDPNKDGTEMELPSERWEPDEPSPEMLFIRAASRRITNPLSAARKAARGALTMPRSTASRVMKTTEGFARLASSGPSAPRTFLNQEIGRDRRVAYVDSRLDDLKAMRGSTEATVNDVILSVSAGALRRYFERRREPVPESLVALVPMSVRRPDEDLELGNRIATLLVTLPIAEADPVARLERIHDETARLKRSEQANAASLIIEATGWTPPTINRVLAGAMSRPLVFNLVISNVPGPQVPFYLLGRKLSAIYPFVPLSPQNHALAIGVLSYDGSVCFGIVGDRDVITDIDLFVADLQASLAEQAAAQA